MNYDELLKRVEDHRVLSKWQEKVTAVLGVIHAAASDVDYEVYGSRSACIFMRGSTDALILSVNDRFGELEAYHPTHGWNVSNGRPDDILAGLMGRVLTSNLGDEDSSWLWNMITASAQDFYKTEDHDIYYGKTALRAAEAYAQECSIPLWQAFRSLRAFCAKLDGVVLKPPPGELGAYMGTLVLEYRRVSMRARTTPWTAE